ncbi:CPBP family intramembrane glutamic endopeptidase [Thermogemmatispora sp.]|uniref:CPBP family intramembrane glutamic endopeptidase n=1 Tax=Thermogemmatispora sp. TaxID=1968838 RepID=UPI001DA96F2D|nr:CPBP family intramembrane glutamic endopeptidase [Thermogemmatispora sp.]MBX5449858.1 CPBP family intramembrane metalloprotease [Thermogemmatispora sp.]
MNGLIPIPELQTSLLAALLLLHASPVMLANRLAALLAPVRRVPPLWLYFVVLGILIGGDLVLIAPDLYQYLLIAWPTQALAAMLGLLGGGLGFWLDQVVTTSLRKASRRASRPLQGLSPVLGRSPGWESLSSLNPLLAADATGSTITRALLTRGEFPPPLVVAVGMLEEIIYRRAFPWLLGLVLPWQGLLGLLSGLMIANLFYGLIHLSFGGRTIFTRWLLGLLFAALVLVSGSVLAASMAHGLFNWLAMKATLAGRRSSVIFVRNHSGGGS